MSELRKININGEEFQLAGTGGSGNAGLRVIFGRAIPLNARVGDIYFFQDGKIKLRRLGRDPWTILWEGGIPCAVRIPEGFKEALADLWGSRDNTEAIAEYLSDYAYGDGNLSCATASPNFVIEDGKVICIKKTDFAHKAHAFNRRPLKERKLEVVQEWMGEYTFVCRKHRKKSVRRSDDTIRREDRHQILIIGHWPMTNPFTVTALGRRGKMSCFSEKFLITTRRDQEGKRSAKIIKA